MSSSIIAKGVRVNNLKGVDVEIPRNRLVVITGLSGSGKSSLAFDTLYAEGQRRYVESLSAYARQFLGKMHKPEADFIRGLPPAIAIEQKVNTRNPRSTVGTSTEIYDYLRLLFGRIGKTVSPISGSEVKNTLWPTSPPPRVPFPRGHAWPWWHLWRFRRDALRDSISTYCSKGDIPACSATASSSA